VICTDGFGWVPDYNLTNRDIAAAYEQVGGQYNIDHEQVVVGGFSGGAIAAIEVTMANTIPVKGFVSLCPSIKPDSFSKEAVQKAQLRGVKGVMFEGQDSGQVPAEQQMLAVFEQCDFEHYFHVNPGIGHEYPTDFGSQLQRAVDFVLS
jgi:predicted esterase